MATDLKRLRVRRVSLVDEPASQDDVTKAGAFVLLYKSADGEAQKAEWSTAQIDELPDAAFSYIVGGGQPDESGKTVPRSLRKLPFKGPDGKVDLPHLRNALARLDQTEGISAEDKAKIQARLQSALAEANKCSDEEPMQETTSKAANPPEGEDAMSDELKAQVDKLQADVAAITKERDELKGKLDAIENSPEAVEKRKLDALPADIRKRMDEQAAEIAKLKGDADKQVAIKKAAALKPENITAEALGEILLRIEKKATTEDDLKEIERVIKALSEQVRKSNLLKTLGSDGNDPNASDNPQDILVQKARALMSKDKGLDYQAAMGQVCKEDPDLWERARRASMRPSTAERSEE